MASSRHRAHPLSLPQKDFSVTSHSYVFRWALLTALLLTPFLRVLLNDGYGLLYPEVLAAVLLIGAIAAGLAPSYAAFETVLKEVTGRKTGT